MKLNYTKLQAESVISFFVVNGDVFGWTFVTLCTVVWNHETAGDNSFLE